MSYDIAPGRPDDAPGRPYEPFREHRNERSVDRERAVTGERTVQGAAAFDIGGFAGYPGGGSLGREQLGQQLLRRYLLTRALGASVVSAFQWTGVGLLLLAVLSWLGGLRVLGVLIGLAAIAVLLVRAALSAVQRRLSGAERLGPEQSGIQALVGQTRRGLRHELRRVGLPGSPWGPLLIARRLIRRRSRAETLTKLARIDLVAVVPQSRVDELQGVLARMAR